MKKPSGEPQGTVATLQQTDENGDEESYGEARGTLNRSAIDRNSWKTVITTIKRH